MAACDFPEQSIALIEQMDEDIKNFVMHLKILDAS